MLKIRAYVVILIIQFILMAMFLIYALVQRTQAIKNEELLIEIREQSARNEALAQAIKIEAQNQAKIAQATAEAYKKELEACMMKK